ncbi:MULTISPECIES: prepilin-type N-terminal cleavage/methylation domain-containing protein [unclassified Methylobacterium]|uniref:prepilin-type N-terminal cleavage/methylation domain-containing protein n=1 Tax=unclassified Methylobacterium TaxID=2615210 RepID=UPI000152DF60|nr:MULTISPECIES: prepilin-type N-terminal cleavage/methylation domain-containing protein [unclassified Methylobacterium]
MPRRGRRGSRPGGPGREAGGFSLVELLVVLAILALAALLGGAALDGMLPARRLDRLAAGVAGELASLRGHARRTGELALLRLDPARGLFLSSRPGAPPLGLAGYAVQVEPAAGSRAGPGEIRFAPDGSSSGGTILIHGRGGGRRIAVSRLTGRVGEAEAMP